MRDFPQLDISAAATYLPRMADDTSNIVIEHLRHIRGSVDRLADDIRELKHRVTTVEQQMSSLTATEANHYASLASRMDRIENRLDRIERRLELTLAG
jgi:predicted  nucleic acid-binding Zn-ribbon protein